MLPSEPKAQLESVSDSSDWNHERNGFTITMAVREVSSTSFHMDRITRVSGIADASLLLVFHAQRKLTLDAARGCNVFVNFVLGDCFDGCEYSYDKTYLPSGWWWGESTNGPRFGMG